MYTYAYIYIYIHISLRGHPGLTTTNNNNCLVCRDALPARGSAATEDILPNDRQECIGHTCPRASDILRVVLIFFFRILGLLVGRLLVAGTA